MSTAALLETNWNIFTGPERRSKTPVETPIIGTLGKPRPSSEELSEVHFVHLAETDPRELLSWIQTILANDPPLLTFAAEAAGRIRQTPWVVSVLVPLLRHPEAVVREGAVYGLIPHLNTSLDARSSLRELLVSEPSRGVRTSIEEALASLS